MKRLYVCRHGESELNARGIYAGQTDTPLTDRGREQARLAGQQAIGLEIDVIVASPLVRAHETAQIIAEQIDYPVEDILTTPLIMERNLGPLEGQPYTVGPETVETCPDIEPDANLHGRARAALQYLDGLEAATVLIVSHGTFLTALNHVLGGQFDEELPNAHLVEFELEGIKHDSNYVLDR
jgi:probable phosphoglycerate mutase